VESVQNSIAGFDPKGRKFGLTVKGQMVDSTPIFFGLFTSTKNRIVPSIQPFIAVVNICLAVVKI
jgi:hypothetical protein